MIYQLREASNQELRDQERHLRGSGNSTGIYRMGRNEINERWRTRRRILKAEGTAWAGYGKQLCVAESQMENEEFRYKVEDHLLYSGCLYSNSTLFFECFTPSKYPVAIKAHLLP